MSVTAPPVLRVSEIFDTLSGEAPTAGQPATFVRLHGCAVRCTTCDTLYAVYTQTRGYKKGYLQGMRAGAGQLTAQGTLRIAAVDPEALDRTGQYWAEVFPAPTTQAQRLGGSADGLELSGPEAVEAITQTPRTEEERRGFVGGCFDAQGSCVSTDGTVSRWRIEVATADDRLLGLLARGLDDWRFPHARRAGADNGSSARLHTLHLGANNPEQEGEAAALADAEQQRFFDTFRPASLRKYGPFLRRWPAQELGVEEIVPQCHSKLVVVSGGEPLQQNLDGLIAALRQHGHTVQIETSGAFEFQGSERPDILVCSPKPNMGYRIAQTVYHAATIFKLVNGPPGSGFDWNGELAVTLRDAGKQVYVMPWGGPPTQEAIAQTGRLAQELGVAFSPRLHYQLSIR
jgi:organic radical activating enzyme